MTNGLTYNNLGGRPELGNTGFDWLGFNRIGGVPIGVIVLAVVAIVCHLMLTRTAFGRWLYASGGNERAAELSGVPTKARQDHRLRALGHLRRHRRPRALVAAHLGRPDRRHHLRADRDRRGGHRRRGADRRPRHRRRHHARRLRHRLPLGRPRDRRRLRPTGRPSSPAPSSSSPCCSTRSSTAGAPAGPDRRPTFSAARRRPVAESTAAWPASH